MVTGGSDGAVNIVRYSAINIPNVVLLILFMLCSEYCQHRKYCQVKQRGKAGCALTRTNNCVRCQDGWIEGGNANAKYVNLKFEWKLCKC